MLGIVVCPAARKVSFCLKKGAAGERSRDYIDVMSHGFALRDVNCYTTIPQHLPAAADETIARILLVSQGTFRNHGKRGPVLFPPGAMGIVNTRENWKFEFVDDLGTVLVFDYAQSLINAMQAYRKSYALRGIGLSTATLRCRHRRLENDISHFNRSVRKALGINPRRYRKAHRPMDMHLSK